MPPRWREAARRRERPQGRAPGRGAGTSTILHYPAGNGFFKTLSSVLRLSFYILFRPILSVIIHYQLVFKNRCYDSPQNPERFRRTLKTKNKENRIMSEKRIKHTGDDQLVYGMPKHMVGVAGGEKNTYWKYAPKPDACEKCQAMKGLWFTENPGLSIRTANARLDRNPYQALA
ncbi:MAG: hypothetical protein JW718_07265 [Desulfovibrionaceae bacterium]|nr:hypothetical protein [Desulfovibrionaceae bacterium]